MPFNSTVNRSPFIVILNVFHSPIFLSAFVFGVTPRLTSAGIFLSILYPYTSPEPIGQHQILAWHFPVPRSIIPESESGNSRLISLPFSFSLCIPLGKMRGTPLFFQGVALIRQSTKRTKSLYACSDHKLLSPGASLSAS